jgi:hypothetical protein
VLASLTILYSLWEKKNETTKQEIEREMAMPLDILDEIGQTYGPTRKLHQALANLVAATIENLERSRSGAKVQRVPFGSPTQNLVPLPMQLPVRIDASLHFEHQNPENPLRSPVLNSARKGLLAQPETQPIASLSWPNSIHDQEPAQLEVQVDHPETVTGKIPTTDSGVSPSGVFDDSMPWGPSLEWTGGWDDFLNAIAM